MNQRITLRQIASDVGCSVITVSRALRNLPNVRPDLKAQIAARAKEVGYRPDPSLAALVSYRPNLRGRPIQANLAVLIPKGRGAEYKTNPHSRVLAAALEENATQLGYHLEFFELGGSSSGTRILRSRGVRGLIIPPTFEAFPDSFDGWPYFTGVQILGYQKTNLLNAISRNEHLDMTRIMSEVLERNFKRPAFLMRVTTSTPRFSVKRAIFEMAVRELGLKNPAQMEFFYPSDCAWDAPFERWLSKARPDVLVTDTLDWSIEMLESKGIRIPQDCSLISTNITETSSRLSGLMQDHSNQALNCMKLLHSQLIHGEFGLPELPLTINVQGVWHPGQTLRD
jgi:LacI family transcriptional regulator